MGFTIYWQKQSYALFDSFGIEYILQDVLSEIKDKSITHNVFRIQSDLIMCGCYCITFLENMIAGKPLLDYSNLFSPNDYKKYDKIMHKYFKGIYGQRKRKPWF